MGYNIGKNNSMYGICRFRKENPNWKGGRKIQYGYVYILKPSHPFTNNKGYIYEHRLVMEKYLGRYLKPEERIHHKGIKYPIGSVDNKQDNRIENLQLFPNHRSHMKFHHPNGF